jgi:hypothetical protein
MSPSGQSLTNCSMRLMSGITQPRRGTPLWVLTLGDRPLGGAVVSKRAYLLTTNFCPRLMSRRLETTSVLVAVWTITGGASGIGRATAVAFARAGARVVIGDIDGAGAEKTVASISENGGEASSVRVDVTKVADVQKMIAHAVARYGGLDYAFNNAGFVGSNAGSTASSRPSCRACGSA